MQVKVSKQNSAFYPIMGLDRPMMCHYLCRPHKTYEIYDRCLKMIVKDGLKVDFSNSAINNINPVPNK